jgi:hypothetical protein
MSVEDFDAAMERVRERNRQADAATQGWQRTIAPGHFCVAVDRSGVHYVEILEVPDDRFPPLEQNVRWSQDFTRREPGGTVGTFHVAAAAGFLTQAQFDRARELDWPSEPDAFAAIVEGDPRWERRE